MNLTINVLNDGSQDYGYQILLDGTLWIEQIDYIPFRVENPDGSINYEASAQAHIDDIEESNRAAEQARIDEENAKKQAKENAEKAQRQLDSIEANTSYIVMMNEPSK